MAANDLSEPLQSGSKARRGKVRKDTSPAASGGGIMRAVNGIAAVLVAGGIGMTGWVFLRNDPLGGEPVATLALNSAPNQTSGVEGGEPLGMRSTLGPDGGETAAPVDGVVKITIGGNPDAPDDNGVRITTADDTVAGATKGPVIRRLVSGGPLSTVPDPGLVERSHAGVLPRIGLDGRRPAQVYARPADVSGAPRMGDPARVAIMIDGLGISASSTDDAIQRLPEEVSLAFAPYGRDLQTWVNKARQNGHEVLLQLPMEPFDYPDNDPGPHTLLASSTTTENMQRLQWLMSRFSGYFGVTNYMGAKFTSTSKSLTPVLDEIAKRGLAFVDDGRSARSTVNAVAGSVGLSASAGDVAIDGGQTKQSVEAALKRLEATALERGYAVGTGSALPATVAAISAWAKDLRARGLILVPVSAVVNQQPQS